MATLTPLEVKAMVQAEKNDAMGGANASELSAERQRAMDYYLGDMRQDMPAPEGRSRAVSTDVLDTVEGLMPALMEIFTAGDDVVEFQPVGPEDEEAAKQETDYTNHVFMQKNPGFLVLYSFIKDALLSKTGVAKVFWENSESVDDETYHDQSDDQFLMLAAQVQAGEIEIVEHSQRANDYGGMLHDVTVRKTRKYGCARVVAIPPEEFGISRKARSLRPDECTYCYHTIQSFEARLIEQGYDPEQVKKLPSNETALSSSNEEQARDTVDEGNGLNSSDTTNRAARPIVVTEHYIRMSYKDGEPARLYCVTTAGAEDEVLTRKNGELAIDKVDGFPFAAMTPIIQTHRFYGRSIADLVMDIQRIKTALLRALLDNAYMANNQRIEVAQEFAAEKTLDDLLVNRPGGIVRTKRPGGIVPIQNQQIGNFAFPLVEYMDNLRDNRTGVTKQGQGLDADALQNQSATAVNQAFSAAQARMKLIARIFAETGVKDLFSLLHGCIRKNDREQHTVRLRNKWVPVDPREWRNRDDMTINVGLGSGTKETQIAALMNVLGLQKEAIPLGLAKPKNLYASASKLIELVGLKSPETYFTDPAAPGAEAPQQPPDPKVIEAQGKLQLQAQQQQADMALKQQQAQADERLQQAKLAGEMTLKREQIAAEMALKREQLEAELVLKREQLAAELDLKRQLGVLGAVSDAAVSSNVHPGGEPG